MEFANLIFNVADKVVVITLNRPPVNALNQETLSELSRCVEDVRARDDVRALIITGQGKYFAAGADIAEFPQAFGDPSVGEHMAKRAQGTFSAIHGLTIPVIAAINGACLGGGLELAMSCHLRLCANEASLGQPEINLGIIPGFGGTQRLPRLINPARALELILTGRPIDGRTAERLGLVNHAIPLSELMTQASTLANELAHRKSRTAVAAALRAVIDGTAKPLVQGLVLEATLFGKVLHSDDGQEGVTAFQEKRNPAFAD